MCPTVCTVGCQIRQTEQINMSSVKRMCRLFSLSSMEAITSQDDNNYRLLAEGSVLKLNQEDLKDSKTSSTEIQKSRTKEYKTIQKGNQTYDGTVLYSNIHGNGFYFVNVEGGKVFYDGLYYLNHLEGYGQVFYEKGYHFQGLFKKNLRYGPGIVTYMNLTQDVGIWKGFQLIRLFTAISCDIPTLAESSSGKAKLLKYRYLISLNNEDPDYISELLEEFNIPDPDGLKRKSLLNSQVTDEKSAFFMKDLYDENFSENYLHSIGKSVVEVLVEYGPELKDTHESDKAGNCRDQSTQTSLRHVEMRRKLEEFAPIYEQYAEQKAKILELIEYCTRCCAVFEPEDQLTEDDKNYDNTSYTSEKSNMSGFKSEVSSVGTGTDKIFTARASPIYSDYLHQSYSPIVDDPTIDFANQKEDEDVRTVQFKESICVCPEELHEDHVDLDHLEDQLRHIETQEWFYKSIVNSLSEKLAQDEMREEKRSEYFNKTKKVNVSEIVAWNNASEIMSIQKHCFDNRYSENMVTFDVSQLLKGDRKEFEKPGDHEETCKTFLVACSRGDRNLIRDILTNDKVNVNVTDGRGNSGIFFAAINNHLDIIPVLINFGAKLDQVNDEGLTPLTLCLLKYLAVKNQITSWEKAFLSEIDNENNQGVTKWYDMRSFISLITQSSDTITQNQTERSLENISNPRLVDLFRKMSSIKIPTNILSQQSDSFVFDLSYKNPVKETSQSYVDGTITQELKQIQLTMMALLEYGADPNIGDVPYPNLVCALFSENSNFIKSLLNSGADFNIKTTRDNLTCLHIVAALRPCEANIEICKILLEFGCDPNIKTLPNHWCDQNSLFRGKIQESIDIENVGKNAFHLLCMRADYDNDDVNYFGQISKLFIEYGVDLKDTYLGHSPLSLAVLVGNLQLVQYLIQEDYLDPYQTLSYEMGNVLTLYTLKRFENILPIARCKAMIEMLFEINLNFLTQVGNCENAVSFSKKNDALLTEIPDKEHLAKSPKKDKKKKKKPKPDKSVFLQTLRDAIKDLARKTIIKYIQLRCTDILYDLSEENKLDHELALTLAEFLTPSTAIANLKLCLEHNRIEMDRYDLEIAKSMLEFVNLHQKVTKTKKNKKEKHIKPKKEVKKKKDGKKSSKKSSEKKSVKVKTYVANNTEDTWIEALANLTRIEPIKKRRFIIEPALDDPLKYLVCFNCLESFEKDLKLCPKCQMIYFCSSQCNKQGSKRKTLHSCNLLYYENEAESNTNLTLLELANVAKQNCTNRLLIKRDNIKREEQENLLQLWKTDTYGTKFMKYHYILKSCPSNSHKMHIENMRKISLMSLKQENKHSFLLETHARLSSMSKLSKQISLNNTDNNDKKIGVPTKMNTRKMPVENNSISCSCLISNVSDKRRNKEKLEKYDLQFKNTGFKNFSKKSMNFESLHKNVDIIERDAVVKQLRKVPEKYHRFMEVLTKYFPEIDLSNWFLPYACCSEGQLYYKFCDDLFKDSYSFL